jgi:hypothetical protein
MAIVLGIEAFSSEAILKHWWEWVLVAIVAASGLTGLIVFLWGSYASIRKLLKVRRHDF